MPPFVYFSSYFAVRPRIHLNRLAEREASGELDMAYDFGNLQLLKFLGFTAKELSQMDSEAPEKGQNYGFVQEQDGLLEAVCGLGVEDNKEGDEPAEALAPLV